MYDTMFRPMLPFFHANGVHPSQGLQQVLQSASALYGGTPQQKVETVANLIAQFGVDIGTLDNILTSRYENGQAPVPSPQDQILQQVDQRVNQAMAPLHQQQRQAQIERQERARSAVVEFANDPKNEFYRDVSGYMADIIDVAHAQGRNLTMQQAYDMACQMDPNVQSVLQQRQQRTAQQVAEERQRKEAASSSVSGSPGGQNIPKEPESVADYLEQAWAGQERI